MNIGIIGFGSMGKTHAYAIRNLPYYYEGLPYEAKITAVCTAHHESAARAAVLTGAELVTTDASELINSPTVDIIDICTPNITHYELLREAIAAGKHIYCEKPLCVTAAQANEIAELSEAAGTVCQVVFHNRFFAPVIRASQLISEGRLGNILCFRGAYLHASAVNPSKPAGWKQNREICGGGVLFDLGSHLLDLIYYLCGEFESVAGMSQIAHPVRTGMDGRPWQTNADEAFYMLARLKCGACGTVEASKLALGACDDLTLEINGDRGSIRFALSEPGWLRFYDGARAGGELGGEGGFTRIECMGRYPAPASPFPSPAAPVGWLRGHEGCYAAFLEAVNRGGGASPSFREAAHIQRIMESAYGSVVI